MGCLRGCLTTLLVLGLCAGAVAYYFYAPDLPPLRSYVPSWDDIRDRIPLVRTEPKPLPALDAQTKRKLEDLDAELEKPRLAERQREGQALQQLQATGLPITGVHMLETGKGQPVLAVGVSYEKMVRGVDFGAGMSEGVDALVRLAQTKSLDLSGVAYTTLAVRDDQGRTLFGVTASVEDIERLRQGQIDRREFISRTAARVESRTSVLNAIGGLVQP